MKRLARRDAEDAEVSQSLSFSLISAYSASPRDTLFTSGFETKAPPILVDVTTRVPDTIGVFTSLWVSRLCSHTFLIMKTLIGSGL
jgi:hypothetical protein